MLFIHFKTIFSFSFYYRLLQLSPKRIVGFVLYLYVLFVAILFLFCGVLIHKNLPVFLKNFPQVTFEKGVLTAPEQTVFAQIPSTDFKIMFDAKATVPPTTQELLKKNVVVWVNRDGLYIPSGNNLQVQKLPADFNFTSSPDMLEKNKAMISASLRASLFIISLPLVALLLGCDFAMAVGVLLCFNIWKGGLLPKITILKIAAFLLGPLVVLWLVHLWVNIPLFALTQLILCIIYAQQILNAQPEVFHYEN